MTDSGPPPDSGKKPMWPGFLLGLLVVAPALAFVGVALQGGFAVLLLVVIPAAFVLLFVRDPLLKGIGAGVLTAGALAVLVLFIACYQYLQDH